DVLNYIQIINELSIFVFQGQLNSARTGGSGEDSSEMLQIQRIQKRRGRGVEVKANNTADSRSFVQGILD
ncbi:MAG: hypothetical protein MUO31_03520, partial [Thermodesulfovibrionales bacterium]|nr:hypothetical protein [Thermodesulfovibrionales bacterium]